MLSNKSVHRHVKILNNTLINVFYNFIPNKLVSFNDKDPTWMSEYLKTKSNDITRYMQSISMKIMSVYYITLKNAIAERFKLLRGNKDDYHKLLTRKLSNLKNPF